MSKAKVLIFDMDGVIFDSIKYMRDYFIANRVGVTEEMYSQIFCGNYHDESAKYDHLRKNPSTEEWTKEYIEGKSHVPMFDGMYELLTHLHNAGYILIINTSVYNKSSGPLLKNANITDLFDFVAGADVSKSKIEKFKVIKEKYHVTRDDVLFITDSLGDVKEAELAEIPTVAVTWGIHDRAIFEHDTYHQLVCIVDSIEELQSFITKS